MTFLKPLTSGFLLNIAMSLLLYSNIFTEPQRIIHTVNYYMSALYISKEKKSQHKIRYILLIAH